jgi:hypothetical protein
MDSAKDLTLWDRAVHEHAAAVEAYCEALAIVADQLGRGKLPTLAQLELEESTRLRLENSRAFFTFGIGTREHAGAEERRSQPTH